MTEFQETGGQIAVGGEGATTALKSSLPMPLADLIDQIVDATRVRRYCVKMQSRNDRPAESMIVTDILRMPHGTPKGQRSAWFKKAAQLRESIEAAHELEFGEKRKGSSLKALRKRALPPEWMDDATRERALKSQSLVIANKVARSIYDRMRAEAEATMCESAASLPAFDWWVRLRGVKALGLAFVVGVAGDLSNYPDEPWKSGPACLWCRLGLAPYKGKAGGTWRRGKEGKLTDEEWVDFGYSAERLGELFGVVTIPLFMQQKASDSYRAAYDRRRLRTAETHADWRKARAHNDALRIMTKRLLRDLWQAWRAAKAAVSTIDEMPPADPSTN